MGEEGEKESEGGDEQKEEHRLNSVGADIIIRQVPSEGLSFKVWPAANALVSLLDDDNHPITLSLRSRNDRRRLRILELGSGTGLLGIAAAAILGADVTVTDLANVIGNLEYNVQANREVIGGRGGQVSFKELCWGNVEQMEKMGRDYDLIMGSDLVYHQHLYQPLMETLKWFMPMGLMGEVSFIMAHLKRWKKETAFFKKANKLFQVDVIHQHPPTHGNRVGVLVYRFAPRPSTSPSPSPSPSGSSVGTPDLNDCGLRL